MLTQAPKGTQDMLPKDAYRWQEIARTMREACALAGYQEIRTPIFEHTELFQRGVGDTTDVVQKEMYTFEDKGNRSITLKPEGTAGAVRAFIESHMYAETLPVKLYYSACPCFRYEKPQSGRLRQFHQNGVEVFGAKDASVDAEIIRLAMDILHANGIDGLRLNINSIGCPNCRAAYLEKLKSYLEPKLPTLCKTCQERFERNPMRILDCKEDAPKLTDAPAMLDNLCEDCAGHFEKLKGYLGAMGLEYAIDPRIVRGLDYYTKTVFEIITDAPDGGELTVCGGGRYDGLVEELGGPATPGIGWGMGIERMIMVQDMRGSAPAAPAPLDVLVVTLGDDARMEGVKLVSELRAKGIKADLDHAARSMKAQFKYANKLGVKKVIVIAGDELEKGVVKLRDMEASTEAEVARGEIVNLLIRN
ncbi:MAG: histidine--tRNA ligase [Clostridia bacterium]|nr:histidine--tRNA ligase [Clostridia bacterium]MBQ9040584.1 histidine--tRNA ligase [Clostridia bacterium]